MVAVVAVMPDVVGPVIASGAGVAVGAGVGTAVAVGVGTGVGLGVGGAVGVGVAVGGTGVGVGVGALVGGGVGVGALVGGGVATTFTAALARTARVLFVDRVVPTMSSRWAPIAAVEGMVNVVVTRPPDGTRRLRTVVPSH
jgi:hypothetical protein